MDMAANDSPTEVGNGAGLRKEDLLNDSDNAEAVGPSSSAIDDLPTPDEVEAARNTLCFTEADIRSGIDRLKPIARALGFDDDHVDACYGYKKDTDLTRSFFAPDETWRGSDIIPTFEEYWTSGVWEGAKAALPYLKSARDSAQARAQYLAAGLWGGGVPDAPSLRDAGSGGWWVAATPQMPLLEQGIEPPHPKLPEDMPLFQTWAYEAAQLYGDFPLEAVGFLTGGPAGAFAAPAAARQALADIYMNGTAASPQDAFHIKFDAAMAGIKTLMAAKVFEWTGLPFEKVMRGELSAESAALDAVLQSTRTKVAATLLKFPTQVAAMAEYFHYVAPEIPFAKEFWDSAMSLLPWEAAGALMRGPREAGPERLGQNRFGDKPGRSVAETVLESDHSRAKSPSSASITEPDPAAQATAGNGMGPDAAPTNAASSEEQPERPAEGSENFGGDNLTVGPDGPTADAVRVRRLVLSKLFRIWVDSGKRPADVVRAAQVDPDFKNALLSPSHELPSAEQISSIGRQGGPESMPGERASEGGGTGDGNINNEDILSSDAQKQHDAKQGPTTVRHASAAYQKFVRNAKRIVSRKAEFDARSRTKKKIYHTYIKVNQETKEVYIGRTRGTGSAEENIARRDRNHHMNKKGFGPAQLDVTSEDPAAIRGREQLMIERHRVLGTSANKINGISPRNPRRDHYLESAKKEFGDAQSVVVTSPPKITN